MRHPTQRNGRSDLAMPVIKNGLTTGTIVGWLNGLKSLVRHYEVYNITFTSFETTIVPYGRRGAFSECGDSGSTLRSQPRGTRSSRTSRTPWKASTSTRFVHSSAFFVRT